MEGFLELVEFSIALAGFTSIAVVFANRGEKWDAFDLFRIVNALITSLGAAFLAAIPIGLIYLGYDEIMTFKIEAIIIIIYYFIVFGSILIRIKKVLTPEQRKLIPKKPIIFFYFIGFSTIGILTLTLMDVLHLNLKGLTYFSIVFLLLLSVFAFIRIIFFRHTDSQK